MTNEIQLISNELNKKNNKARYAHCRIVKACNCIDWPMCSNVQKQGNICIECGHVFSDYDNYSHSLCPACQSDNDKD